jgi:XTP/dITP diphosphohydrolase
MISLVLATQNLHKVREFRAIFRDPRIMRVLGDQPFDLLSLRDFPEFLVTEETGKTFRENAECKALAAAKSLNLPVLADDSGLVIPALQGAPGVFSARFAGPGGSDRDCRKALLAAMSGLHGEQRYGFYECWLSLATPEGELWTSSGICEGEILPSERGPGGFGYDPLFLRHEYAKTFGELDEATKNRISHRRRAFDRIMPYLVKLLERQTQNVDS